jgi:hypothetical protein
LIIPPAEFGVIVYLLKVQQHPILSPLAVFFVITFLYLAKR